jgi:hypothetical protein
VEVESKRKRGRVKKDEWPSNGQPHLHHRHKHLQGDEAKMSVSPASVSGTEKKVNQIFFTPFSYHCLFSLLFFF